MQHEAKTMPWIVVAGVVAMAAGSLAEDLPRLCPQPQELRLLPGEGPMDLSAGALVQVPPSAPRPIQLAAERLRAELARRTGRPPLEAVRTTLVVGAVQDLDAEAHDRVPKAILEEAGALPPEGYRLRTSPTGAVVVGRDARGAVYGVETLIQLVRGSPSVPAVDIRDYPDSAWRLTYCAGGDRLDDRLRRIVGLCVHYKLNLIVFENPAFYRLSDPEARARLTEVFAYCRDLGIEPVPELQSFGWSQHLLPLDPLCVEAAPARDRRFRFADDETARPCDRPGQDLAVRNGDLDRAEGHRFADWQQDDVGTTLFADTSERGGMCLMIQRQTPGFSRVSQRVRCEPDTCYEVQVDMRTQAGKDFAAYFEVYGSPTLDRGQEFAAYPHVATTTDWERRSLKFRSGPARELVVYLRIQEGTGSAWFDNLSIRTAGEPPLINIVETPDQPLVVTSVDRATTYRPGVDYDVEPGDLRFPYADTAAPWRVTRRRDGALTAGQEVLLSYEWAEPGDITYCPSEPRTQALMEKAIRDTTATLKPRLIHLGHDEPRVINRDQRCRKRGLPAYALYVDDIRRMHRYVKKADPDCRVMIWADAFRVNDKGEVKMAWFSEEKCALADAVRDMPRDIILCPWRYTETDVDFLWRDLASLTAAGFDVTGSPWYDLCNVVAWGRAAARLRPESGTCLGLFLTTWDDRWDALPITSGLMWTLARAGIPGEGDALDKALRARYAGFGTYAP